MCQKLDEKWLRKNDKEKLVNFKQNTTEKKTILSYKESL